MILMVSEQSDTNLNDLITLTFLSIDEVKQGVEPIDKLLQQFWGQLQSLAS